MESFSFTLTEEHLFWLLIGGMAILAIIALRLKNVKAFGITANLAKNNGNGAHNPAPPPPAPAPPKPTEGYQPPCGGGKAPGLATLRDMNELRADFKSALKAHDDRNESDFKRLEERINMLQEQCNNISAEIGELKNILLQNKG